MSSGITVRVIGGGIIGISIAWELSKTGGAVTVFEAGRVGNEASWAGAGMLAPGGEISYRNKLSDLALESLRLYPGFIDELSRESGTRIDFRRCGAFSMAYSEEEAERLQSLTAQQNRIGIYSEQFSPSRVPGVRTGAVAAQYYPDDAVVNPRDLMRALTACCRRAKVVIREFEAVVGIAESKEFDVTVIAAGAWSGQVKPGLPAVTPVRGHLIAFDLTNPPHHTGISDAIVRHDHTYLFHRSSQAPGSVVIAGASSESCGFDRVIDGRIAQQVAARAVELMPALSGYGYSAWNGLRPATADGLPVIGRFENSSLWLAYGHYRNGILLAPATAQQIAQEINQASLEKDLLLPAAPRR